MRPSSPVSSRSVLKVWLALPHSMQATGGLAAESLPHDLVQLPVSLFCDKARIL